MIYSHNTVLGSHENKWIRVICFSVNKSQKPFKSKQKPRSHGRIYILWFCVYKFQEEKNLFPISVCVCVCVHVCVCVCIYIYMQVLESIKKRKVLSNTKFKVAFSCGRFVKWMCSITKSYLTLCNPMDCSPLGFSVQVFSLS